MMSRCCQSGGDLRPARPTMRLARTGPVPYRVAISISSALLTSTLPPGSRVAF